MTVLCATFAALALSAAWRQSPTYDETYDLAAGATYLRWGDFRLAPEHPPLLKELAALPGVLSAPWPSMDEWADKAQDSPTLLALRDAWVAAPADVSAQWMFSYLWLYGLKTAALTRYGPGPTSTMAALEKNDFLNDPDRLFFLARWPMVALALALALLTWSWSRELNGRAGGLISLTLFCFNPMILAHAPLATTDVGLTAFYLAAAYLLWRALTRGGLADGAGCALACGAAAVSKYSSVLLVPGLSLTAGMLVLAAPRGRRADLARRALTILSAALVCAVGVIWAVYGFRFAASAEPSCAFPWAQAVPSGTATRTLLPWALRWRLLPEAYLYGVAYVSSHLARRAFLFGTTSAAGWWYYFPVAAALKTPAAALALVCVALWRAARERRWAAFAPMLAPAGVYLAAAMASKTNIGLRHILPVFPFAFVLAGASASSRGARALAAAAALGGLVVFSPPWRPSLIYPDFLGYFNELAGSSRGLTALSDSNIDWGQGLKELKLWLKTRGIAEPINLCYFGTAEPRFYGIPYVNLPPGYGFAKVAPFTAARRPGWLAVGATHLQGTYMDEPQRGELKRFLSDPRVTLVDRAGPFLIYRISD